MNKRDEIVAEARSWKETPFHHLGRIKGVGVDCVGIVICTARAVGFLAKDKEWYPHQPLNNLFEHAVDDQTVPVNLADALPGDLMKFKYADNQQHIGIITEVTPAFKIVHSFAQARKVVETYAEMGRFAGIRRFKELA